MNDQFSRRMQIPLERGSSRLHARRRIMRNAWIACVGAALAVWIGASYYLSDAYPFIAEWSVLLGIVAGLATLGAAVWLQFQMGGEV